MNQLTQFWICFLLTMMLYELHRGINLIDTFLNYEDDNDYEEEYDPTEEKDEYEDFPAERRGGGL